MAAPRWNCSTTPPEAAWGALIRHEQLTTEAELDEVRVPLWVCRISTTYLVDLRRRAECERYGLLPESLISDE